MSRQAQAWRNKVHIILTPSIVEHKTADWNCMVANGLVWFKQGKCIVRFHASFGILFPFVRIRFDKKDIFLDIAIVRYLHTGIERIGIFRVILDINDIARPCDSQT